jgi:hypothetical protein
VVDGGVVWSEYHEDQVLHSIDRKLSACATVTGEAMRYLSAAGIGPRDLLRSVRALNGSGQVRFTDEEFIGGLQMGFEEATMQIIQSVFQENKPEIGRIVGLTKNALATFDHMKTDRHAWTNGGEIAADLMYADVIWVSLVLAFQQEMMTPPGTIGTVKAFTEMKSGVYTIRCVTCANASFWLDFPELAQSTDPGIVMFREAFGGDTLMLFPERNSPSMLEQELSAMRSGLLAKRGK